MHIEPGFIAPPKLMLAQVGLIGLLAYHAKNLIQPSLALRTLLAAVFFTLFMEVYFQPVGPSELHFVGAIAVYMVFGFVPTLFAFGLGLALQGFFFHPTDLMNLAVNSLSLMLPLLAVHSLRQNLEAKKGKLTWQDLVKLDAVYYSGVTLMVGFWLLGEGVTNFTAWAQFALSYALMVMAEPLLTLFVVKGLKPFAKKKWAVASLDLAPVSV